MIFRSGRAIEDILFSSQIFISYKFLSYQKSMIFFFFWLTIILLPECFAGFMDLFP